MTGPKLKKHAVVFGAGIAGLTAAHELAMRGFVVEVWEQAHDELGDGKRCAVGGMARSQYGAVNNPTNPTIRPKQMVATRSIRQPGDRVVFPDGEETLDALSVDEQSKLARLAMRIARDGDLEGFALELHGHSPTPSDEGLARAQARANAVCDRLTAELPDGVDLRAYADAYFEETTTDNPPDDKRKNCVDLIIRQTLFPGEHGFRFFPAFYRHLFDTMKRTPLLTTQPRPAAELARLRGLVATGQLQEDRRLDVKFVETARTAYDSLIPTTSQALALVDDVYDPDIIPRRQAPSLEALRRGLNVFTGGLGFTLADIGKLYLKLVKYMTSSSERRAREYESISWWSFIEGDSYSEGARKRLDAWPRALVAMTARHGDARTQGNIIVQLLLDQLLERDYTDGTLNGPTSEVWLEPWRTFLQESQGVRFKTGTLKKFVIDDDGERVPVPFAVDPSGTIQAFSDQFVVVAVSLCEAKRIAADFLTKLSKDDPGYDTVRKLAEFPADSAEVDRPSPSGPLQHLVGIQFFFEEDVQWVNGHLYLPDSEWGLTAISQTRFWQNKLDYRDRYYGQLSVCVADWGVPGGGECQGKCAWELAPDAIAREVWRQIKVALEGRRNPSGEFLAPPGGLPTPIAYHLDRNMQTVDGKRSNTSPLLINTPGEWSRRPGDLERGYELVLGRIGFAGTFMQTHTRLTTMEAANESARHAVNAILAAAGRSPDPEHRGNLCGIWNPEDSELEDLAMLKEIDRELSNRGLPHFLDILGVDGNAAADLDGVFEYVRAYGREVLGAIQGKPGWRPHLRI